MSDFDPPRLTRLIQALSLLGDPVLADEHGRKIHPTMLDVLLSYRSHGHDIGCDGRGGYARPRISAAGPAREMRDICRKARKAVAGKCDAKAWMSDWAALPDRTKHRLWSPGPTLDPGTFVGGFSAPGYQMVAPRPEILLPIIEAEILRRTTSIKRRQRNPQEQIAIDTIRSAYRALTGQTGRRVIRNGQLAGGFIKLARTIDEIFGTKLFAAKDSRRLR